MAGIDPQLPMHVFGANMYRTRVQTEPQPVVVLVWYSSISEMFGGLSQNKETCKIARLLLAFSLVSVKRRKDSTWPRHFG